MPKQTQVALAVACLGLVACATPGGSSQSTANARFQLEVFAGNNETLSYDLSNGSPRTPAASYRREIRFYFLDPGQVATYMIVTGPGPAGGNGKPFGLKMLSPRMLVEAPEAASKPGAHDASDTSTFQICATPAGSTGAPEPTTADCVGSGVKDGIGWGWTLNGPVNTTNAAAADAGFAGQGWVEGGTYTIAVYADDGWKTVNGQSGKTPIATYTRVLQALPYTFAQMRTAPAQYPTITSTTPSLAQIANAARTTGGTVQLSWKPAQPPAGGKPQELLSAWVYGEGVKTGSTTGSPHQQQQDNFQPVTGATTASVQITGKNSPTNAKRLQSFGLQYGDRRGRVTRHTTQLY